MARYDSSSAECAVLTFKEGLLSAIAHDLFIRVTQFEIDVDDATKAIDARFDARSLRVAHAMEGGAPRPEKLSGSDKHKIEQNIVADVLDAREHPEVRFTSNEVVPEGDGYRLRGTLALHGQRRPIDVVAQRRGEDLVAEVRLHQPDFGIKPYTAMLGALKIKPDVVVRCTLPRAIAH